MASIKSPVEGFTGIVVGVHFKGGVGETDNEGALNYFGRHGYTVETPQEPAGPFDPSKHTVEEIRAYVDGLDDSDPDARDAEFARVVEAERAGKGRKSFLESVEGIPANPPAE